MRRRRLCRPTPCAQPSTADQKVEERSGRAIGADGPRFCRLRQNFAEGPQLRLALAMLDAQASALQAKWGHGVGRHARQMRGEIVSTCKNLRVRSRSLRVQTGLYRSLYPLAATFLQRNGYRNRSEFSGKAKVGQALEQTICLLLL